MVGLGRSFVGRDASPCDILTDAIGDGSLSGRNRRDVDVPDDAVAPGTPRAAVAVERPFSSTSVREDEADATHIPGGGLVAVNQIPVCGGSRGGAAQACNMIPRF